MRFLRRIYKFCETWYFAFRWHRREWIDRILWPHRREASVVAGIRASLPVLEPVEAERLLIDLSVIHKHDAGTGIQRVVRSLRDRLPAAVGPDVAIDPLMVNQLREGYVTFTGDPLPDGPRSLFLGLDFATDAIYRAREQMRMLRMSGTPIWFLIHDVLPISHPDWFTPASRLKYRRWIRVCAALSDGILCVSPDVARQVEALLTDRYRRLDLPRIVTITPGSDIASTDRMAGIDQLPDAEALDASAFERATLIVGTLEPRKGHADALAAFNILWDQGHTGALVLLGRKGWNTESLQAAIRGHVHYGRLLFWFEDATDTALHAAYRHCRLTLVPSLAEGYGLPLDEALALGSPVLVRDIPVFRRYLGNGVRFFPEKADATVLAQHIRLALAECGHDHIGPTLPDWNVTARQIAAALGFRDPAFVVAPVKTTDDPDVSA